MFAGLAWNHSLLTSFKIGHTQVYNIKPFYIEPTVFCSAHRALPDVEAMEQLFTQTALSDVLASVPK